MRATFVSKALAKRVRLPGLRRCEGLGTVGKAVHLGMRGLRSADLGDSRHGHAWHKLPLTAWFTAIHLLTSHSNGISALQLQAQLGLRSYKSAWLLLPKLRRAMVDPDRLPLAELVEVDESEIPYRTKDDPPAGGQGP